MKKITKYLFTVFLSFLIVISFSACSTISQIIDEFKESDSVESTEEVASSSKKSNNNKNSKAKSSTKKINSNADPEDNSIEKTTLETNEKESVSADEEKESNNTVKDKISGVPEIPGVISSKNLKNDIANAFQEEKKYSEHSFPSKFKVQTVDSGVKIDLTGLVGFEIFKLESENGKLVVIDASDADMDSSIDVNFITANGSDISQKGSYLQINEPAFYLLTALYDNPNPVSDKTWAPENNSVILNVIVEDTEFESTSKPTDDKIVPIVEFKENDFVSLDVGQSITRKAYAKPSGKITYESSDVSIATVNKSGKVTAESPGTVTITATCGDAFNTYTLTVSDELNSSESSRKDLELENNISSSTSAPHSSISEPETAPQTDSDASTFFVSAICYNSGNGVYDVTAQLLQDGKVIEEKKEYLVIAGLKSVILTFGQVPSGTYSLAVSWSDTKELPYKKTSDSFVLSSETVDMLGGIDFTFNANYTSSYWQGSGDISGSGGSTGGSNNVKCYTCKGLGYKNVIIGAGIETTQTCSTCGGRGSIDISGGSTSGGGSKICSDCNGAGGGPYVTGAGIEIFRQCPSCGGKGRR